MSIKFTKKQSDNSIQLTRNCSIRNWDPIKEKDKNKPIFNFNAYSNGTINNIGNVQEKLLKALAGGHKCSSCDDSDNLITLTEQDLKEAAKDKSIFEDIKIKEYRYDEHYGIANITTAKGDVLRVDLLTEAEIRNVEDSSKGIFKSNKKQQTTTEKKPEAKKEPKKEVKQTTVSKKTNKQDSSKNKQVSQKTTPSKGNKKKDVDAFLIALGNRESGGDHKIMNKYGYVGLYQVGEEALHDVGVYYETPKTGINYKKNDWKGYVSNKNKYGITCLWDFMHSPKKQKAVQIDFKKLHWQYLKNLNLTQYVGKTIKGTYITQSGLLAGAHLVGPGGVRDFLRSNGKNDVTDANGTPVSSYIKKFAGYDIKEITQA